MLYFDFRYTDVSFFCPYPRLISSGIRLDYLTLIRNASHSPTFLLEIHHVPQEEPRRQFSVCLGGSLLNIANYNQFVEWVELNRMFGAEHFTVYVTNVSTDMKAYLQFYEKRKVMTVYDWKVPTETYGSHCSDVRCYAQLTLYNDCISRSINRTRYLILCDLDEFIVPRDPDANNWADMIREAGCEHHSYILAKHTAFNITAPIDPVFASHPLMTPHDHSVLLYTRRMDFFMEGVRGKCIVRPERVRSASSAHSPPNPKAKDLCVLDPRYGGLYHYRHFNTPTFKNYLYITDQYMHRFGEELLERATSAHHKLRISPKHGH